MGIARIQTP